MTWEKEKAYRAKRAQALGEAMDAAIAAVDDVNFTIIYQTAMNYMKRGQLNDYMKRFLIAHKNKEEGIA